MNMPSASSSLWEVACDCAILRLKKKCLNDFCSPECNGCRSYLYEYIEAEPAKVKLLMYQAEATAASLIRANRSGSVGLIAFLTLPFIIGFIIWRIANSEWILNFGKEPVASTKVVEAVVETSHYDDEGAIQDTLKKVSTDMKRKKDVNGDGKVNCIDAALLFYKYYPYKDKVTIEYNYNPSKDFNHMFNAVFIGGNWIAVEPQAKFCGYDVYRMKPIWGNQYEWTLNRDVTKKWLEYVR